MNMTYKNMINDIVLQKVMLIQLEFNFKAICKLLHGKKYNGEEETSKWLRLRTFEIIYQKENPKKLGKRKLAMKTGTPKKKDV